MSRRQRKCSEGGCMPIFRRILIAAAAALILAGCGSNTNTASESGEAQTSAAAQLSSSEEDSRTAAAAISEEAGTADSEVQAQGKSTESAPQMENEAEESVTVVIPTVYENVSTQEEADEIKDRNGYESATLEEDGSLTVVMSRSQYEEMLLRFKESVDKGISEIIGQGAGSTIEKIDYNDDYSVFTVTVSGEEIGIIERQTADELVMYGTLYHIYTGNDADHIHVDYVSRESGGIIESADSGSLESAY